MNEVKLKCRVCGKEFKPKKEMRYTGIIQGVITNTMYDCYDCPGCGAQYRAQERIGRVKSANEQS